LKFNKYQALGNDYLVLFTVAEEYGIATPSQMQRLCNRNFGVGSDGVLVGPLKSNVADFRLRIFNPDGSEAEKSGNGLRIFCRFLWDEGYVKEAPFTIETKGGVVSGEVLSGGREVKVGMGQVSFSSDKIPVVGNSREVLLEEIRIGGRQFRFCAATIGNPHCVIPSDEISEKMAREYGPLIEVASIFPNRTNVQFLRVLDRRNIQIEIWERGAGYTLASGSSSCAAAAVARRLGLCDQQITVHMPGGRIAISVDENFGVTMQGPVVRICSGKVDHECFA
jgi:diaminopimelate epimerase